MVLCLHLTYCVWQAEKWAPQRCPTSNSQTCEYVTFMAKVIVQTALRLRTLGWRDFPELSRWTQSNESFRSLFFLWSEKDGITEEEPEEISGVKGTKFATGGFEDEGRGHKPRNTGDL